MDEEKSIDQIREELGLINFENQHLYSNYFLHMPKLSESDAIGWIKIFGQDDYDDYCALAWDIVLLTEKYVTTEQGLLELTSLKSYWAETAAHSRASRPNINNCDYSS